jgi:hypothetical protein
MPQLQTLRLDLNVDQRDHDFDNAPAGVDPWAACAAALGTVLRSLPHLREVDILSSNAAILSACMAAVPVRSLYAGECLSATPNLSAKDLSVLCQSLHSQCRSLQSLSVGPPLKPAAALYLTQAVQHMSALTALSLRGCDIRGEAAAALCGALRALTSLRDLELAHNEAFFGVGVNGDGDDVVASCHVVALLRDALPSLPLLTWLDLTVTGLNDACLVALAPGLAKASLLAELNIEYNPCTHTAAAALVCSLPHAHRLRRVLLGYRDDNKIKPRGPPRWPPLEAAVVQLHAHVRSAPRHVSLLADCGAPAVPAGQ